MERNGWKIDSCSREAKYADRELYINDLMVAGVSYDGCTQQWSIDVHSDILYKLDTDKRFKRFSNAKEHVNNAVREYAKNMDAATHLSL